MVTPSYQRLMVFGLSVERSPRMEMISSALKKPPAKPASKAGGRKRAATKADGAAGAGAGAGVAGGGAGKAVAAAAKGKAAKARPMEAETAVPGEKRRRKQPAPPAAGVLASARGER